MTATQETWNGAPLAVFEASVPDMTRPRCSCGAPIRKDGRACTGAVRHLIT